MTEQTTRPASTVVIRHKCDCPAASQPPGEDGIEHRFDVDGAIFPWYISEEGPRVTQLDGMYTVEVTIFGVLRDDAGAPSVVSDTQYGALEICGLTFPWSITADGLTYRRSHTEVPTVHLSFFAEHVDTDGHVKDRRHIGAAYEESH